MKFPRPSDRSKKKKKKKKKKGEVEEEGMSASPNLSYGRSSGHRSAAISPFRRKKLIRDASLVSNEGSFHTALDPNLRLQREDEFASLKTVESIRKRDDLFPCGISQVEWSPGMHIFECTREPQEYLCDKAGFYLISATGASGADVPHSWRHEENLGGSGVEIIGVFKFWWGCKLSILVGSEGDWEQTGQTPYDDTCRSGGGGGASMISIQYPGAKRPILRPVMIAGGGGGATSVRTGRDASTDETPTPTFASHHGANLPQKEFGGGALYGAGGAGMISDGQTDPEGYSGLGGQELQASADVSYEMAKRNEHDFLANPDLEEEPEMGGYGGGGGAVMHHTFGGGGGGGYTGGAGALGGGGGGSSFIDSGVMRCKNLDSRIFVGARGDGVVRIECLCGENPAEVIPQARLRLAELVGRDWVERLKAKGAYNIETDSEHF